MTWQAGQPFNDTHGAKLPKPLANMLGAVWAASLKPAVAQGLGEVHKLLEQVPNDIDWAAFNAGVVRYQASGRKGREEYPELAREGRVSLRDAGGSGPRTVVLVPSLVNRGYVLDLCAGRSVVGALREAGFRVLLIDWGDPSKGDGPLTLDTLIVQRLEPLVRKAAYVAKAPVRVFGYCMGGLLALASAVRLGKDVVNRLALGAMPWDFSVTPSHGHMLLARPVLEPWLTANALIPPEAMQQYFWLLDPWSPVRRLSAYGKAGEFEAEAMTALEDWLTDGLPLDGPVGREMLMDWYADNRTMTGNWLVGGVKVVPQALEIPVWVAVTQRDVLVPPMCSLPFAAQARGAGLQMVDTGHVGLVCGRKSAEVFYKPLIGWFSA